jgi:hypothetical protein
VELFLLYLPSMGLILMVMMMSRHKDPIRNGRFPAMRTLGMSGAAHSTTKKDRSVSRTPTHSPSELAIRTVRYRDKPVF